MEQNTKRTKKSFSLYDASGDLTKKWFWHWYDDDGKRQRKYGLINKATTLEGRRAAAMELLKELEGLNPAPPPPPPNHAQVEELYKALNRWRPTVRHKSYITYKTKLDYLKSWLNGRKLNHDILRDFFTAYAVNHAQTTVHDCYRMLFLLFKRAGLQNFLIDIVIKKGQHQPLRYFQPHQATRLKKYISEQDPELWLWCQFVYFCFIRPRSELRFLQVKHIFFGDRKILIPGNISKNNKSQFVAIPNAFYPSLEHYKSCSPSEYLFPGREPGTGISKNVLGYRHRKILDSLGFDHEYAVYSWKHTGAVNAVKAGISLKQLQIQLRHHSLDMVDKYLRQLGVSDLGDLCSKFPGI